MSKREVFGSQYGSEKAKCNRPIPLGESTKECQEDFLVGILENKNGESREAERFDKKVMPLIKGEKAKSSTYIKGVNKLYEFGIGDLEDGWFINSLTLEKGESDDYLNSLIKMYEAGIIVTGFIIHELSLEKGSNEKYVEGLINSHKAGIQINGIFVEALTLEKGSNEKYVEGLINFHKAGIQINGIFVEALTLEKGIDEKYVSILLELNEKEYDIDLILKEEKAFAFNLQLVLGFGKNSNSYQHMEISKTSVNNNQEDSLEIQVLKSLKRHGIEMQFDGKNTFLPLLMMGVLKEENVGIVLKELQNTGEKITIQHFLIIDKLEREGVDKKDIIASISNIVRLINADIDIFNVDDYLWTGYIEKLKNAQYVSALIDLKKAGITIDIALIGALTLEKGTNLGYLFQLKKIQNNQEEAMDQDYVWTKVIVTGKLISELSVEQINNPEFLAEFLVQKSSDIREERGIKDNQRLYRERLMRIKARIERGAPLSIRDRRFLRRQGLF